MPYQPTDTASKIVALLHNAETLAVYHQQRFLASDVVKACRIFSESRGFSVPGDLYTGLESAVKGKNSGELALLFSEMKKLIVSEDMRVQKSNGSSGESTQWKSMADKIHGISE